MCVEILREPHSVPGEAQAAAVQPSPDAVRAAGARGAQDMGALPRQDQQEVPGEHKRT